MQHEEITIHITSNLAQPAHLSLMRQLINMKCNDGKNIAFLLFEDALARKLAAPQRSQDPLPQLVSNSLAAWYSILDKQGRSPLSIAVKVSHTIMFHAAFCSDTLQT